MSKYRQRPRRRLIAASLGLLAIVATACSSSSKSTNGGSTASSSGGAAGGSRDIIIGASVAKTGSQTFYGGPAMVAAKAAISDINARGGVNGRQIKLVWEDSQTDFAKSAEAAQKVISQGASVMLVDCDFDYGLPAAQVAQDKGIVAMNLCAGSPRAGDPKVLSLGFSMGVATNVEAAAMASYAHDKLGYKRAYLLRDNSIEYSKSVCDYFSKAFKTAGGQIAGVDEFNNKDTSVQGQVSRLTAAKGQYDVINICSYAPGLTTAVRQIRAAGIDTPLVGSVTWDGDYWLGSKGAGELSNAYFPAYGSIWGDDPRSKVNDVVKQVKQQMGDTPFTSFLMPGYSAIEALAKGIEKAGTTDGKALKSALESLKNEPLLVGPVTYSPDVHTRMVGTPTLAIMKIDKGKPSFVELYPAPANIPAP